METSKKGSVSNTLAFSSIVLSIVCFMALVQVEVELHAHRKMLQVLTHNKEGNVSPSQTGNNELIAFPPHGYSSKGECQFTQVGCWMNPHVNKIITCLLNFQRWKVVKSATEQYREGKRFLRELNRSRTLSSVMSSVEKNWTKIRAGAAHTMLSHTWTAIIQLCTCIYINVNIFFIFDANKA